MRIEATYLAFPQFCLDVQVLIVMPMRMAPLPEEFPGPRYGNDEKWLGEFLHPF
jgi:hypothetical protein